MDNENKKRTEAALESLTQYLGMMDKNDTLSDHSVKQLIAMQEDRLASMVSLIETFQILGALSSKEELSTEDIAFKFNIERERVESLLLSNFQGDSPWCSGRFTDDTMMWSLAPNADTSWLDEIGKIEYDDDHDRRIVAFNVLKQMGLDPRKSDIEAAAHTSPAMAMTMAMWDSQKRAFMEQGILSILNKPKPIWAGAKGFDQAYMACMTRARSAKILGFNNSDGLTQMHCYAGAGMFECRSALVTSAEQVMALPQLEKGERNGFVKDLILPMSPYFFDYTGESQSQGRNVLGLPSMESPLALEGRVGFVGALVAPHDWAEDVLLITPFVIYNVGTQGGGVSALGMVAVNQSENVTHEFHWGGEEFMFNPDDRLLTLIPTSPITDENPGIIDEYRLVLAAAAEMAISMLHLLSSANVSTVPATLERRERKRADKRGWNVAEVVYVHRSRKRYPKSNGGTGESREFTHQFDVVAHYRHFTKGPHVWCRVCKGDPIDGTTCSVCHGTGLDPDRVKPCTRIDESTGELTCPNGCRREFVPQHVRGPEDAIYIPKVRKFIS